MDAQKIVDAVGLGGLAAGDILAVQLIVLAATFVLFGVSLIMMIAALRSAGGAHKARSEAEGLLRSAQDFTVEARQLSAQRDRYAAADAPAPIRVSARETTPEADVEVIDLKHSDVVSNRNLDAAKEQVTVPRGLTRRRRRRF
jgi:hypothetical protein